MLTDVRSLRLGVALVLLSGCNAITGVNDLEEVPEQVDSTAEDTIASDTPEDVAVAETASDTQDAAEADACTCGATCASKCANGVACASDKDCTSGLCVRDKCSACPKDMAGVSAGTVTFCVDVEEVTNAEYEKFLASSPKTTGQPAGCAGNGSYVPGEAVGGSWPLAAKYAQYPVRYVDWCDAAAYCKWAGKRLCGKIGGGPVAWDSDWQNPGVSEWMRACSSGGANVYTYPGSFDLSKCNSKGSTYAGAAPITALPECVNAYGHHDMTGNASEWEDNCQTTMGATDLCHARGGSYGTLDPKCAGVENYARAAQLQWTGIRCCKDGS